MTVKTLISILKTIPQHSEVIILYDSGYASGTPERAYMMEENKIFFNIDKMDNIRESVNNYFAFKKEKETK